jgi:hypothetical protein
MKSQIKAVAVTLVLAAPVASFAQQNQQPLTRAQVRAGVVQAAQSGYSPLDWTDYSEGEVQAAQFRHRIQTRNAGDTSGYGAGTSGTSESGDVAR